MLRMGRPRTRDKDLPLGVRPIAGRYYVRPVNEAMRRVFARVFPGKQTAPLGADKLAMRKRWIALFCAPESETAQAGTVGELVERFLRDELEAPDGATGRPYFAPATQRNYRGSAKRVKAKFGSWRYARTEAEAVSGGYLRTMHVRAYLKDATDRPHSANQDVVLLATVFRFARNEWGATEYNPCDGVRYNASKARQVFPSDDQFMDVYRHAKPTLQCMMDLAQMTGARRGSIAAITLADIRDDGLRIVSNKTKRGATPKETVYGWTDELRAVVNRAVEVRSKRRGSGTVESIHLFLTNRGRPFGKSALDSQWERALERAGIERAAFHFHDIRAKSATESGDDLDAMKRLGHTDMRTTRKVYRRRPDAVAPLRSVSKRGRE